MKILFVLSLITFITCQSTEKVNQEKTNTVNTLAADTSLIDYVEFIPEKSNTFELDGFEIDYAYKIDSLYICSAYSDGDLSFNDKPTNWGDRLVIYSNNEIIFQSKPVGDVYLFEPHFYKNELNNTVIIICQLGYEYFFGGEAFLLNNGKIQSIGSLEIESTDPEKSLTDIVLVHEDDEAIYFKFKSDSLIYKPGSEDLIIKNDNVHYRSKNESFKLYNE